MENTNLLVRRPSKASNFCSVVILVVFWEGDFTQFLRVQGILSKIKHFFVDKIPPV